MRSILNCLLLASAASSLVGCGDYEDSSSLAGERGDLVSAKLRPYVDEFIRLFGTPLTEMPITIGLLGKGKAGVCVTPPSDDSMLDTMVDGVLGDRATGERHIVISSDYFKRHKDDPARIQQVVFHEMGHCYLERPHDTTMMPTAGGFGFVPDSIMHPVAIDSVTYTHYHQHYVAELFGRVVAAPAPAGSSAQDAFGECVLVN